LKILIIADRLLDYKGLENNIISMSKIWSKNNELLVYTDKINGFLLKEFRSINLISGWKDSNNEYIINSFKPDIILNYSLINTEIATKIKYKISVAKLFTIVHRETDFIFTESYCELNERFISLSDSIKNAIKGKVPFEKIKIIYPGINMKDFYPTKKGLVLQKKLEVCSYWYTIIVVKNLDNDSETLKQLIEVAPTLAERVDGLNLIICGNGNKLGDYKKIAKEVNSNKLKIIFTGQVKNMRSHINLTDLVLGDTRVAIEAILCNKKVFFMANNKWKGLVQNNNFKEILFTNKGLTNYSNEELTKHLTWMLVREADLEIYLSDLMEKVTDICDNEIVAKEYLKLFEGDSNGKAKTD
jgi:glycosyltransferase involved in cell wall biosynthesis